MGISVKTFHHGVKGREMVCRRGFFRRYDTYLTNLGNYYYLCLGQGEKPK